MTLEGHVGELPEDTAWVLSSADARFLLGQFDKLTNWTLDSAGSITADAMPAGIQMVPMTDPQTYRVAQALPCPDKPLAAPLSALRDVAGYIAHQREENAEKNRTRAEKKAFPASVELSIQNDKLSIRLPSTILTAGLGDTSAETDFGDKTIAANDIENLAATLARHDADAHGWIMDSKDVDDAALVLEAHFGNDVLRIVMPTQTGSDYNQVCEALAL